MDAEKTVWCIAITFADTEKNGFVSLGGAGLETQAEWEQEWNRIPASPLGWDDPAMLILDKLDENGDRIDERPITAETAAALLGKPLDVLISEGREKTCFTLGEFLDRHPEMASRFNDARTHGNEGVSQ